MWKQADLQKKNSIKEYPMIYWMYYLLFVDF